MEAVISFKFYSSNAETEKEVTVDATKVIETVNSEIDKYLKKLIQKFTETKNLQMLLGIKVMLRLEFK